MPAPSSNAGSLSSTISSSWSRPDLRPVLFCLLLAPRLLSAAPAWWTERGVVDPTAVVADYAPAVLGQLKCFATNAADELEAHLPGGAGTNVWNLVGGFQNTSNACVANVGQLKAVAVLYWQRLEDAGYTNAWPWTTNTVADDVDQAATAVGQLKAVFDFDLSQDSDGDGLVDWVETATGIYVAANETGSNPNDADSDDDGTNDGDEVANRTDPNNNDVTAPVIVLSLPVNGSTITVIP